MPVSFITSAGENANLKPFILEARYKYKIKPVPPKSLLAAFHTLLLMPKKLFPSSALLILINLWFSTE